MSCNLANLKKVGRQDRMNVLQNLLNFYNTLPVESTNRSIVKKLLVYLPELENVTIDELAARVSASRTTVWRVVKQMGYENYHAFSHELSQAIRKFTLYNKIDMGHATADPEECRQKIIKRVQQAEDNLRRADITCAEQIVEWLYQADRVGFYNYFNQYVLNLQMNLAITGKESNIFYLKPEMLADAKTTDANTVTFVRVLEFAEVMDITDVFVTLKAQGGKVILAASDFSSRYDEYADFSMRTIFGSGVTGLGVLNEDVMTALIDEIYRGRYVK